MKRLLMTLSGLALTLAASPSAHAAAWLTPPETVSRAGMDAIAPLSVGVDPAKDVFLAWQRDAFIDVGVRPAGESFGISSLYGCPTNPPTFCTSAHHADVAVDPDGNALAVFVLNGGLKAFFRPAGGSFTKLDDITSGLPGPSVPHAAFTGDGTAIVVWEQSDVLYVAERPPGGGSFGTPAPLYTASGGEQLEEGGFDLATGDAGRAMVAFGTHQASTAFMRAVTRTPAGWLASQEVTHESVVSDSDCSRTIGFDVPTLSMDGAGDAAVAFAVYRFEDTSSGLCTGPPFRGWIAAARWSAAFAGWSPPDSFDDSTARVTSPATTFSAPGKPLVAWIKSDASGSLVRYAAGPSGGISFDSPADVPGSAVPVTEGLGSTGLVPLAGGAAMVGYIHVTVTDWKLEWASRPAGGPFSQASPATAMARVPTQFKLGASPAGDVVATWLEDDDSGTARVRSLIYDASPPVMGQVNVPVSGKPGDQLALSAAATDAFSPITFNWAFGDGAASPGPEATHAYGAPGSFEAAVNAVDAAGNTASATRTVEIDASPDFVGGLMLAHTRFRAARRGGSATSARRRRRAPVGTAVSFRLSEAAAVKFGVERARPGRRVRGRCAKPTRTNRKRRRCTRYVRQRGQFTVPGAAGQTRFRFTGRLRNRKLRPGPYRLVAVATDATGNRSAPERAKFTILR